MYPVAVLMGVCGVCAALSGSVGYLLADSGIIRIIGPLASRIPSERHAAFLADGWAHGASYAVGFVGGLVLIRAVWVQRGQGASKAMQEHAAPANLSSV